MFSRAGQARMAMDLMRRLGGNIPESHARQRVPILLSCASWGEARRAETASLRAPFTSTRRPAKPGGRAPNSRLKAASESCGGRVPCFPNCAATRGPICIATLANQLRYAFLLFDQGFRFRDAAFHLSRWRAWAGYRPWLVQEHRHRQYLRAQRRSGTIFPKKDENLGANHIRELGRRERN